MKIKQESFLSILGMPQTRFVIPLFQRVYSWEARQCDELWDDVMRAGRSGLSHFAGVLLFCPDYEDWGPCGRLSVIDGQQRLTTVTLLLLALRDYLCSQDQREAGGDAVPTADQILATYLRVFQVEDAPVRLQLSFLDRVTLECPVLGRPLPEDHSKRLVENRDLFRSRMDAPSFDPEVLWRGLQSLEVVSALLDGDDSPQLIFESLNSKGKALSAADLVRNSLLFSLDSQQSLCLYQDFWRPMEQDLADRGIPDGMESLLRAWLASRYRDSYVKNESDVFTVLKKHLERKHKGSHERLLRELMAYERRYAADQDFRSKEDKNAGNWLAGKSAGLISQRKLFGD